MKKNLLSIPKEQWAKIKAWFIEFMRSNEDKALEEYLRYGYGNPNYVKSKKYYPTIVFPQVNPGLVKLLRDPEYAAANPDIFRFKEISYEEFISPVPPGKCNCKCIKKL
uniref:ABC transporter substrate-binding protein n=1 Tax=Rhabditophanes sp. KR3021 TaxID=114890 RepID=A0AC35U4W8_9BILA